MGVVAWPNLAMVEVVLASFALMLTRRGSENLDDVTVVMKLSIPGLWRSRILYGSPKRGEANYNTNRVVEVNVCLQNNHGYASGLMCICLPVMSPEQ